MKWMIASDLHGSARDCRQMLEAMDREQADRLLLLGDLLGRIPGGLEERRASLPSVADQLNARADRIVAVRGNCDTAADQARLRFPLQDSRRFSAGSRVFHAAHRAEAIPTPAPGEAVLFGHTHEPECTEKDGRWFLNPGSVSQPRGRSQRGYMILTETYAEWKTLDGMTFRRVEW